MLKEWKRESRIVLQKNPNYYAANSILKAPETIEFRSVKEGTTAVTLFKNGELDIVRDLPPIQLPMLAQTPEFVTSPQLRTFYMGFNLLDPQVVSDVKVRRSIAMAIDRSELVKVLGGMVTPTKSWLPAGMLAADAQVGVNFDRVKAKALWQSLRTKPTSIEIWFDSGERNKLVAENLQSQIKKVLGLELVVQMQEWKVFLRTVATRPPAMWRLGWGAAYPDPDNFMTLFKCGGGKNYTGFCQKDYDRWLSDAAASPRPAKRVELYTQAQRSLLEAQVAIIPLFSENSLHLVSKRVHGFVVNPTSDFSFKRIIISPED